MNTTLLAAAISGILLGANGLAAASPADASTAFGAATSASQLDVSGAGAKHGCKGQNDCKGQGGCKTEKNACKGQNGCKGQGGCATDGAKAGGEKGGAKNGCGGPNGCGSK